MIEGFVEAWGDEDGVVNAVEVDRKELLLPNENQDPEERVTVEAEVDVSDDVLETESAVDERAILAAAGFLSLANCWTGSCKTS